jgi:hypothetical protein
MGREWARLAERCAYTVLVRKPGKDRVENLGRDARKTLKWVYIKSVDRA